MSAIKAINTIAQRLSEARVIPAGSTYKLRDGEYYFRGKRLYPSYLQVGPSYNIEKSKHGKTSSSSKRATQSSPSSKVRKQ
jgi:hypothetical protein